MYGKIFESIYEGSLYGQWEAIVTFQQMIVLADQEGFIEMTPRALASRTSIPQEIIQKGIEILEQPDPDSRTDAENGCRIVRINPERRWGWKIVNYEKYRDIRNPEDRRRYMREYMRDYRKRKLELTSVNNGKPDLTHTDEDLDTDKDKRIKNTSKEEPSGSLEPFKPPHQDDIDNASITKTSEWLINLCNELKKTGVFKNAFSFKNKFQKEGKSHRAILHALIRVREKRKFKDEKDAWAYAVSVLKVENGNYNEREYSRKHQHKV